MRFFEKLSVLLFLLFLGGTSALAAAPKDFDLQFRFPHQGARTNEPVTIEIDVGGQDWDTAQVTADIQAITYAVPSSFADNARINPGTRFVRQKPGDTIRLPLRVVADGEYTIVLAVTLHSGGRTLSRARAISVAAENGILWFGVGDIENAIGARIRHTVEADSTIAKDTQEATIQKLQKEAEEARKTTARKNANLPEARAQLLSPGAQVTLNVTWPGRVAGGFAQFPLSGAKITVSDKDVDSNNQPLTPSITGYVVNGSFSFNAPRQNYSYKVSIDTEFPGITPAGGIQTSGGGIGSFRLVSQTSGGPPYSCTAENVTTLVCDVPNCLAGCARAWSAFHGMAEMIVRANAKFRVQKRPNLLVVFESPSGTSYLNNVIKVIREDAYDWDVVGHEFGHAMADETNALDRPAPGGPHDWINQYGYGNPNTQTKGASLHLALSEGFGTWIGTALTDTPSAVYSTILYNKDHKYSDTEDQTVTADMEANNAKLVRPSCGGCNLGPYYGEDTELGVGRLLYDLSDSIEDSNTNAPCPACKDVAHLDTFGMWRVLDGSATKNVIDLYNLLLDRRYHTTIAGLLPSAGAAVDPAGLEGAFELANSYAEFGIAPYLTAPAPKTKIDLVNSAATPPTFRWTQSKTGSLPGLSKFTLALYSIDHATLLFKKPDIAAFEYTLTPADVQQLKAAIDGLTQPPNAVVATVVGTGDTLAPPSGPYMGNAVELMVNNVDRTMVVVVDSSGSNQTTDPQNLRISAAKETLRRLKSAAEAAGNNRVPDLAGAVDFDDSAVVLSQLDDPDAVIPRLNGIDSAGGTDIAAGINSATQILENLNTAGLSGLLRDKASIAVFTDGENNAGTLPVIQAIVAATLKGVRVHYGFLRPQTSPRPGPYRVPSDAPPGYVAPDAATPDGTLPATIAEAVLASGGVYAIIGNAESQVAFAQQIEDRGYTNSDGSYQGTQRVVGQTETFDVLPNEYESKTFQFRGAARENARVVVNTFGNFAPSVRIDDRDGSELASAGDTDNDGIIELALTLPYSGEYSATVTSTDGRQGLFSVFVDVQNPGGGEPPRVVVPVPALSSAVLALMATAIVVLALFAVRRRRRGF